MLAACLGAAVGVAAGLVAGYLGGRVDAVIMRIADLNLAFPLILLALAVVALLGANLRNLVIVMAITTWMIYARVVRGLSLGLREREFVQAARALGAHDARIIVRHVLPNVVAPVMVIWTLEVARIILMESALSFLGLGVPPPTPTWGRMLAEGRDYLTVAGWIAIFPGSRSWSRCSGSTSSATVCATCSTRACGGRRELWPGFLGLSERLIRGGARVAGRAGAHLPNALTRLDYDLV